MHWPDRSGVTGGFSVMDFGALFSQQLATFWWLPPLLILAALFKSAWFKPKRELSLFASFCANLNVSNSLSVD